MKYNPDYHAGVIRNLRSTQPNLAQFTDEQIWDAHDFWSSSEDYPDESKVADYIEDVQT